MKYKVGVFLKEKKRDEFPKKKGLDEEDVDWVLFNGTFSTFKEIGRVISDPRKYGLRFILIIVVMLVIFGVSVLLAK